MKKLIFILFLIVFVTTVFAGGESGINRLIDSPGREILDAEKITLARETNFSIALKSIEVLSQKFEGKKILNTSSFNKPIGTPLNQLFWKDALKLIVYYNNLKLEELPGVFLVKDPPGDALEEQGKKVDINDKSIEIGAVFFQMDKSFLNSLGIDWSTITEGTVLADINHSGASKVQDAILSAGIGTVLESGAMRINLNALLKTIEGTKNGSVIARPRITVISGKKGKIQVGEDFSVKTTDEQGNTTDKFFQTGVIMDVTPTFINDDKSSGIHLVAKVEKSSASPGEVSTVIQKSFTETEVILFDGEETVMAGMYDTEEIQERVGIPILKDLPWWVLGIRYLAGFEKIELKKREMVIVLSAKVLDTVNQRKEKSIKLDETLNESRKKNKKIEMIFRQEEKNETAN